MSSVTSISLSAKLRDKPDEIQYEKGYSSGSEVVKDAIKTYLSEQEISKVEKGTLTAIITAMYQKCSAQLDDVLLHLRHEYDDIVEGNLDLQVDYFEQQKAQMD